MALFDNLIAYYKLDGNCRDSVNMYDGIPNNITFVDGKIGECAQTNGNSQYISLPNEVSVKGRTQVSYSGWCFIESELSNDFYIIIEIANSNDYARAGFGVNTSLLPFAGVRTVATGDTGSFQKVTDTSPISKSTWYFLCAVFDLSNGNIILYVNGVAVGSLTVALSSFVDSVPYRIRIFELDASGSGSVRVDELGIWSKALSAAEVSELYNNGAGKTYSTGTSGGTGVVIDGLFLSTSKPTAGDKGLLINNKFFIPFAKSSGSGGDTSAFESDAMAIIGTPTGGGSGGGMTSRNSLYYFPLDEDYKSYGRNSTFELSAKGDDGFVPAHFTFGAKATGNIDVSTIFKSDFTVDFWSKVISASGNGILTFYYLWMTGAEKALLWYQFDGNSQYHSINGHSITPDDNWHHFAIVRSGTNVKTYMDGTEILSAEATDFKLDEAQYLQVDGGTINDTLAGSRSTPLTLDELHITDSALWTANFIPPTLENSLT